MRNELKSLKTEPNAVDLEEVILGAVLSEKEAMTSIMDLLRPEMFYTKSHQIIFDSCVQLSLNSTPIDLFTIQSILRKNGNLDKIGGLYYLTKLTDRVVSSANIEYHARIIAEMFIKRELIKNASAVVERCYDQSTDVFDLLGQMNMSLDAATEKIVTKKEVSNASLLNDTFKQLQIESQNKGLVGIPSGLSYIDAITGGWHPSDLIILAARPGMGKTSMAITLAINAAKQDYPVAFFSLEMANDQIMKKVISIVSDIPFGYLRSANLQPEDWSQLQFVTEEIAQLPIYWDDTPGMTITEIVAKAKRMKRKYDIKMIFVDYLQFITPHDRGRNLNRDQEIGYFSRSLKNLAKELGVPVVALAQLSRAVETRKDMRPVLSDLRESGSIEQDADIVSFLYRPEYYGFEFTDNGGPADGYTEFIIAKHRNGPTDKAKVEFNKKTTGFRHRDEF